MIIHSLTVGPFMENTYLVADEESKVGVVVDPGSEVERILAAVDELGIQLEKIINTHGHIDHVGAVAEIRRRMDIAFYLHEADEFLVEKVNQIAAMLALEPVEVPTVDHNLREGDTVAVGAHVVEVIHTPGHSPGGVCFHFPEEKVLLVGDTLFAGSVGRVDLEGGSAETLLDSIQKKLAVLDPETRVHSGHGPATTIGREVATNPYLQPGAIQLFS